MPEKEIEEIKRNVRKWSDLEIMIQRFTQRIFAYGVTPKDIKNLEKEILEKYVLKLAVGEAIEKISEDKFIAYPVKLLPEIEKGLRNMIQNIKSELKKAVEGL